MANQHFSQVFTLGSATTHRDFRKSPTWLSGGFCVRSFDVNSFFYVNIDYHKCKFLLYVMPIFFSCKIKNFEIMIFIIPINEESFQFSKNLVKDKFASVEKMFLKFCKKLNNFSPKRRNNWLIEKNDKPIILFCVLLYSKTTSCWAISVWKDGKLQDNLPGRKEDCVLEARICHSRCWSAVGLIPSIAWSSFVPFIN